jgi:hypothetical protein
MMSTRKSVARWVRKELKFIVTGLKGFKDKFETIYESQCAETLAEG